MGGLTSRPPSARRTGRARSGAARTFAFSVALTIGVGLGLSAPALGIARAGLARGAYTNDALRDPALDTGWLPAPPILDLARVQALAAEELLRVVLVIALVLLALTAVALLTLIASRSVQRRPEMAVRAALGASPGPLARTLAIESVPVLLSGVMLGLLVHAAVSAAIALTWPGSAAPWGREWLDPPTSAVAAAVLVGGALLVWIAPARVAGGDDLRRHLATGARATAGPAEALVRRGMAVLQVAMSVVLLSTAGVLARGHWAGPGTAVRGIQPESLTLTRVSLPGSTSPAERARRVDEILTAVRAAGGATRTAAATPGALVGVGPRVEVVAACAECSQGGLIKPVSRGTVVVQAVSPGFFDTVGASLRVGRGFSPGDAASGRLPAVISEAFAHRLFPNGDPIGKLVEVGGTDGARYTVADVVEGIHAPAIGAGASPAAVLYVSTRRHPPAVVDIVTRRGRADPAVIRGAAPVARVSEPVAVDTYLRGFTAPLRWLAWLFVALAAGAVLLATSGLYAVVSEDVAQRTREIGIRMALGAGEPDVRRLVVRRAAGMVLAGAVVGTIGASGLARLLDLLLGGVDPLDPLLLAGIVALLAGVAITSARRPAGRAAAVDPQVAIRRTA